MESPDRAVLYQESLESPAILAVRRLYCAFVISLCVYVLYPRPCMPLARGCGSFVFSDVSVRKFACY